MSPTSTFRVTLYKNGSEIHNIQARGTFEAAVSLYLDSADQYRVAPSTTRTKVIVTEIDTVRKVISGTIECHHMTNDYERPNVYDDTLDLSCTFTIVSPHARIVLRRDSVRVLKSGDTLAAFEDQYVNGFATAQFSDSSAYYHFNSQHVEVKNGVANDTAFQDITSVYTTGQLAPFTITYVPISTKQKTYKLQVRPGSVDLIQDTLTLYIRVSRRYYTARCKNADIIRFDAGSVDDKLMPTATGFENTSSSLLRSHGLIVLNNFLKFNGDLQIDTSIDKITYSGEWYVDTVVLPLGYGIGRFALDSSVDRAVSLGSTCNLVYLATSKAIDSAITKLIGFNFRLDSVTFIDGGIRFGCAVTLPFEATACIGKPDKPAKKTEIALAPIELRRTGIGGTLQVSNFGLSPGWCINKAFAAYYSLPDSLALGAEIRSPFFEKVGIAAGWQQGQFNALSFAVELSKSIPLGNTTLGLLGVRGGISGWNIPPLNCALGATLNQTANKDLMNFDVDVSYKEPSSLEGKAAGKLFKVGSKWQAEAAMKLKLDWNKYAAFEGTIKAGTLGADYAFNGSASLKYTWNPKQSLDGLLTGSLSVPKLGVDTSSNLFNDYVNCFLPIKLSEVQAQLKAGRVLANINYYSIFKGHFALDLNKSFGDKGFIDVGWGNLPLSSAHRKGVEITGGPTDRPFTVQPETDQVIFRIRGPQVAASTLTDPDGKTITATASDSSVIYVRQGSKDFWYVRDPKPGSWKVHLSATSPNDSIDAAATLTDRPFTIEATQNGNTAHVTWSGSESRAGSTIDLFLTPSKESTSGIYVGTADASTGSADIQLDDKLPECHYQLYAVRESMGGLTTAYASVELNVTSRHISVPGNVVAIRNTVDSQVRVWADISTDATALLAVLEDGNGEDSVLAISGPDYLPLTFHMPDTTGKQILLISRNDDGEHSCPTPLASIVEGVHSSNPVIRSLATHVLPNPSRGRILIGLTGEPTVPVAIEIFDLLGARLLRRIVLTNANGNAEESFDLTGQPTGSYYYRVATSDAVASGKIIVEK